MLSILFRCLLFCSGLFTLNAALALPLNDTLADDSSYEKKQGSVNQTLAKQANTEKYRNVDETKSFYQSVVNFLSNQFVRQKSHLNHLYSSTVTLLKKNQTLLFNQIADSFRLAILPFFKLLFDYAHSDA